MLQPFATEFRNGQHFPSTTCCPPQRVRRTGGQTSGPPLSAMRSDVKRKLQTCPDAQLVENTAKMVLDDLLRGAKQPGNLRIRSSLPNQRSYVNFSPIH